MSALPRSDAEKRKRKRGDAAFWFLAVLIAASAIITTVMAGQMRDKREAAQRGAEPTSAPAAPASAPSTAE